MPVTVERPSSHAAIVHFDYGVTPAFASAVGISRSPLREWHAFATVRRRAIRLPPAHLACRRLDRAVHRRSAVARLGARGAVSAPMAKVALLYERVVYVVTGSGIGPCLGQILAARVPARLVWSTRDPRATYGDASSTRCRQRSPMPSSGTRRERGKPDLAQLAQQACRTSMPKRSSSSATRPTTLRLVHGLERLGIPAFGPIWDS